MKELGTGADSQYSRMTTHSNVANSYLSAVTEDDVGGYDSRVLLI